MASNNGGTKKRRSLRSMASNEKKRRKMATSPCNGKENVTVPLFLKSECSRRFLHLFVITSICSTMTQPFLRRNL